MFQKITRSESDRQFHHWDEMSDTRFEQLYSGRDLTQCRVLCPAVLHSLDHVPGAEIIDIGCGVGYLTELISHRRGSVVGIDPSYRSICLAQSRTNPDIKFEPCDIRAYAKRTVRQFDIAISNLVLMNVTDLKTFMLDVASLLKPKGIFIFTITNPYTWPRICEYENDDWFDYDDEIFVRGPFRISTEKQLTFDSWHAHRPLRIYVEELHNAGFVIESTFDPFPSITDKSAFEYRWSFPRYSLFIVRKH